MRSYIACLDRAYCILAMIAEMPIAGTYFLHKRIKLCENALAIVTNICL